MSGCGGSHVPPARYCALFTYSLAACGPLFREGGLLEACSLSSCKRPGHRGPARGRVFEPNQYPRDPAWPMKRNRPRLGTSGSGEFLVCFDLIQIDDVAKAAGQGREAEFSRGLPLTASYLGQDD